MSSGVICLDLVWPLLGCPSFCPGNARIHSPTEGTQAPLACQLLQFQTGWLLSRAATANSTNLELNWAAVGRPGDCFCLYMTICPKAPTISSEGGRRPPQTIHPTFSEVVGGLGIDLAWPMFVTGVSSQRLSPRMVFLGPIFRGHHCDKTRKEGVSGIHVANNHSRTNTHKKHLQLGYLPTWMGDF